MAIFVVDASVALAWCFEDEASTFTDELLERLWRGDQILVPAHWPTEVSNALLVAHRRKRITADQPALLLEELARLPIDAEPALTLSQSKTVLALSAKHTLTVYDAAYLELAQRRDLPLATLDADLRRAAELERVALL